MVLLLLISGIFVSLFFAMPGSADRLFIPYLPPGEDHWLGTDNIGQDIFCELLGSGRLSLVVGLVAALAATFLGTAAGCVAGYFRSLPDRVIMRCADLFLLIPGIPLVIVLVSFLEPGIKNIILVIGLTSWPGTARVIRSRVMQIRESPFILNSRSMGAGDIHIILNHILPNTKELILAKATLAVAGAMLTEAGISFLGLGDPRNKTWGTMLHDAFTGASIINGYWWWYLPPIACIALSVTGFNIAGYFMIKDRRHLSRNPAAGKPEYSCNSDILNLQKDEPITADMDIEKKKDKFQARTPVFDIMNLGVTFQDKTGRKTYALNDVSLSIQQDDRIAIIGETGSGKSILFLAMLGLLPAGARVSGDIFYRGKNMHSFCDRELREIRALEVIYIPQGAGSALNPVIKLGHQVSERNRLYSGMKKREGLKHAAKLFKKMGIQDPEQRVHQYPHQFSGGMKQRALLAMAMAAEKGVILADEPTKGLDWETRTDILNIFKTFDHDTIAIVTHDLWFAEGFAKNIAVMYSGMVVETGPTPSFFKEPLHPYSQALLNAQPSRGLDIRNLKEEGIRQNINPSGCSFVSICPYACEPCRNAPPVSRYKGHQIRCWRYAS